MPFAGFLRTKGSTARRRELAKAAGVSEALLYKHFPSKESLYAAMLDACVKGPTFAEFKRILTLDPSTSTLVFMVHFVVTRFVQGWAGDPNKKVMDRLSVRSLLTTGLSSRLMHKKFAPAWLAKFEACLKAAAKAGEMHEIPLRHDLRAWLVHHIAFALCSIFIRSSRRWIIKFRNKLWLSKRSGLHYWAWGLRSRRSSAITIPRLCRC